MPLDLPPPSLERSDLPDVFDAQLDAHIFEDLWGPGGCGPQLLVQEVSSEADSLQARPDGLSGRRLLCLSWYLRASTSVRICTVGLRTLICIHHECMHKLQIRTYKAQKSHLGLSTG